MAKVTHILISQSFLPGGGGVEITMHQIAQEILRRNLGRIEIVCLEATDKKNTEDFDRKYNVPIYRSSSGSMRLIRILYENFNGLVGGNQEPNLKGKLSMFFAGFFSTFLLFGNSYKRIRANRGRKIIITCFSLSGVLVADILTKTFFVKEKIYIVFSNGFVYKKSHFIFVDWIIKKILKDANFSLCVSNVSAQSLIHNFSIKPENVISYRIWLGPQREPPAIKASSLNEYGDKVHILFVGRIVPEKGIQEIINLAEYINRNKWNNKYEITIIGDSTHPIVQNLKKSARIYSCLKFAGRVDPPESWKYYLASDIFLMPSIWEEGAGSVILESYWNGVPVVGSNRGGIPEYLKTFTYYGLIQNFTPKSILNVINQVYRQIRLIKKKNVYQTLSAEARENYSAKNFSVYESIYKNLIS